MFALTLFLACLFLAPAPDSVLQPAAGQPAGGRQPESTGPVTAGTGDSAPLPASEEKPASAGREQEPALDRMHARARAAGREISLQEAIRRALRTNADVRIRSLRIAAARLDVNSHKAKMLPLLKVESTALFWNDKLEMQFSLPRELLDMLAMINPNLHVAIPPILVRKQLTWQTSVTVIQPLSPLLTLSALLDLKKAEIDAARAETSMEKRQVAQEVENLYINAMKADAYLEVLDQAQALLDAQRARVAALIEAQAATPAEMARVDAADADLAAKRARALSAILLSRQALAYLLGDPLDFFYRLSPPVMDAAWPDVDSCSARAMRERPEFEVIRARRRQVHEGRQAQQYDLFPRLVALTQYKFSEGFGDLEPRNQWFAGLALSWELQWNEKWRELEKLDLAERELDVQTQKAERGIRLEISKKYLEWQTARAVMASRRAAEAAARIAHDTQVKLFNEKMATNTDVLSAQTQWLSARVERENAQWDELAAALAYLRSCGP